MPEKTIETLRAKALELWEDKGLLREPVSVRARTLSAEEAIGDPEGGDFPLRKGKERLMEAAFQGVRGQAFTDMFGDFSGTLADIAAMPLENNFRRAVFVSTLNASLRSLGLCDHTVHCRDEGPTQCALKLREHISERYGDVRITQVGFQPKFVAALAPAFKLRVLDLDPDNIGKTLHGARIEGPETRAEAVAWADLVLVTGSSVANGSLGSFLTGRPVLVFGVTGAAAATLLGLDRFCVNAA
ncbi:MAG: DUF364 domain-containing protein [Humidesulfovibrio sp.]|nr:DUF364 domain-containing protein [Humidesulfovibrio sp.]